jgi:uncharacterized protein YndB with AHSA1/START domain
VWKVWNDPAHIAKWWGPACFTNKNIDWNPRAGAKLNVDMVGPDGSVYPMPGRFVDVKEPELLSFITTIPDGQGGSLLEAQTDTRFDEIEGGTLVSIHIKILLQKPGIEEALAGMEEGWSQMLDKLSDDVHAEAGVDLAARTIEASRVFDAPREFIWDLWADPKHMQHWWGPRGFTLTTESHDFKPGGHWKMVMHGPDGKNYDNFHTYTEIRKPFRIVHEHGGPELRKLIGADFIAIATFDALDPKKTKVTMAGIFPTMEALQFVVKNYHADQGQRENLDKLGEYIAKLKK